MIYFLTDKIYKNYTESLTEYLPGIAGRHVHTTYLAWILVNHGMKNIIQTTTDKNLTKNDILFFHYDDINRLTHSNYKKVQILSDKLMHNNCDLYATSMLSRANNKKIFYLDEPMPVNLKKCTPTFPPIVYGCSGRRSNMHETILTEQFKNEMKKYGIIVNINFMDANIGNEHVYFHLRSNNIRLGFKHSNRIFQSWYLNIPCIHNTIGNAANIKNSPYDFLKADNIDELKENMIKLKTDENLYWNMVEHAKKFENFNNHLKLKSQIENIINALQ